MKQYKTIRTRSTGRETQEMLNDYAEAGWRLVCSYCGGHWLILEREKKK
ncbi:MAG: hypothetical protein ACHQ1D_01115 [Nitrososphaerales archaeon]